MIPYNKQNPLKVFTAFSGYDSQLLALKRLKENFPDFDYECVGWSEIDKYAIIAHNALFPELKDKNYGDICQIDWGQVPNFDLFTMSAPCTDFSIAGLRLGGAEGSGTRSSLLWECRKAILTKKPKFILFENVKNLVGKQFKPYFDKWRDELTDYGYSNFYQVLNAKDYQVPQNRERIFMISILDFEGTFHFPSPMPQTKCIATIMEDEVDEKYYVSQDLTTRFVENNKEQIQKIDEK